MSARLFRRPPDTSTQTLLWEREGALIGAPPLPAGPIPPGQPIPGWTISLSNRRGQHAGVEAAEADGLPRLLLKSDRNEIRVSSRAFDVEPGMKFQMEALFKRGQHFNGDIWIGMELTRTTPNGEQTNHLNPKAPAAGRKAGWTQARETWKD